MPFFELSIELEAQDPGPAEAACFGHGALSVSLTDDQEPRPDRGVFEPLPGEVRLWPRTRLQALFAADAAGPELIVALAQELGLEAARIAARAVPDRIWEREWLRDFHALRCGRRLWICPRHETVSAPGAVVVRLDPGMAFGTGSHPSTALCLEWLDGTALAGSELIDYGCGSGVLAIAALRLGAARAFAYDIDPQALAATRQNAADNAVADRLCVCEREAELPEGRELLVANILAGVLIGLAPRLAQLLAPHGRALLAGLLAAQEAEVAAAYAPWFDIERHAQREGWVALRGLRR